METEVIGVNAIPRERLQDASVGPPTLRGLVGQERQEPETRERQRFVREENLWRRKVRRERSCSTAWWSKDHLGPDPGSDSGKVSTRRGLRGTLGHSTGRETVL